MSRIGVAVGCTKVVFWYCLGTNVFEMNGLTTQKNVGVQTVGGGTLVDTENLG